VNLNDYIDLLRGTGKADKTIADYTKYVRRMMTWCADVGLDPATLPAHQVRTFADQSITASWASRKQARTALAHYWRACGRTDGPWEAVRVPRKPLSRYTGLTPADAALLRDAAALHGGRPGLATLCGLYTGARASEIAGMRHDHITAGTIRWWRTKTGGDWQVMPLHPTLAEHIGGGTGPLFRGNNGRETVSGATVWTWVRKVAETVGMEVTPKQLRSTAGMMVLEATGDLDAAASFLGHRDVNVTRQFYTVATSARRMDAAVAALEYGT